jgi:hypothetical protein
MKNPTIIVLLIFLCVGLLFKQIEVTVVYYLGVLTGALLTILDQEYKKIKDR